MGRKDRGMVGIKSPEQLNHKQERHHKHENVKVSDPLDWALPAVGTHLKMSPHNVWL